MNEFQDLVDILARLRDEKNGCPWDIAQTTLSLRDYIIEEAYELVEAIDNRSTMEMIEELGDLLLQIVFVSRIMDESGEFSIRDVLNKINQKLVQRHPHIFSDTHVSSAQEVKNNWEKIKKKEKMRKSILSDYPESLPSLIAAKRYGEQAASVGFDWREPEPALEKVEEEIIELRKEIENGNMEKAYEELGDLLFSIANVSRLIGINPEFALRDANRKFKKRFRMIENQLKDSAKDIESASLDTMNTIWEKIKRDEKKD